MSTAQDLIKDITVPNPVKPICTQRLANVELLAALKKNLIFTTPSITKDNLELREGDVGKYFIVKPEVIDSLQKKYFSQTTLSLFDESDMNLFKYCFDTINSLKKFIYIKLQASWQTLHHPAELAFALWVYDYALDKPQECNSTILNTKDLDWTKTIESINVGFNMVFGYKDNSKNEFLNNVTLPSMLLDKTIDIVSMTDYSLPIEISIYELLIGYVLYKRFDSEIQRTIIRVNNNLLKETQRYQFINGFKLLHYCPEGTIIFKNI